MVNCGLSGDYVLNITSLANSQFTWHYIEKSSEGSYLHCTTLHLQSEEQNDSWCPSTKKLQLIPTHAKGL
jgi:hypothetical protein